MRTTIVSSLTLIAVLSGCATSAVPTSETTPGTLLAGAASTQGPGTAPVVFKRDSGMMGAMCPYRVFVNGVPTADLRPGQAVTAHVPAGKHIAGVRPGGICGGGDSEVEFEARPGQPRTFRITIDHNGAVKLQPTAF